MAEPGHQGDPRAVAAERIVNAVLNPDLGNKIEGEGNVSLNAPRLSNQHDWYLVRQLQNFKKGVRGANQNDVYGAQMRPMAMILANDQAVNDVAAYINTLAE